LKKQEGGDDTLVNVVNGAFEAKRVENKIARRTHFRMSEYICLLLS